VPLTLSLGQTNYLRHRCQRTSAGSFAGLPEVASSLGWPPKTAPSGGQITADEEGRRNALLQVAAHDLGC
jgi:hypothetical protein